MSTNTKTTNYTESETAAGTATVSEVEIPSDQFALSKTVAALDGIEFELERVVASEEGTVLPFVWARGRNRSTLENSFSTDPSVASFEVLADLGDEWLFGMEWTDQTEALVHALVEEQGTVIAAASHDRSWSLRLLFPKRDALARTHDACKEAGMTMEVSRIYDLNEGCQGRFGITDHQRDALVFAFKYGYYDIPRKTLGQDIADELGISHQALSERLRRAHGNLVENAILVGCK